MDKHSYWLPLFIYLALCFIKGGFKSRFLLRQYALPLYRVSLPIHIKRKSKIFAMVWHPSDRLGNHFGYIELVSPSLKLL
jgi:hypothetical protein